MRRVATSDLSREKFRTPDTLSGEHARIIVVEPLPEMCGPTG
jgi:hypothetical protein